MTPAEFNAIARRALANEPLRGLRRDGAAAFPHHWKVRTADADDPGLVRVLVGAGSVNERVAAITYRRTGDPRGWEMPEDYPGLARLTAWFGPDFEFVDRSLLEDDPPSLLLTLPDPEDPAAPHGFVKVSDEARPRAFWGAADWECELWRASVYLSALPFRADPSLREVPAGVRPPNQPARFRVYAGVLPAGAVGTEAGGTKEIARVWLLRAPDGTDELRVHQLAFWSLRCRAIAPFLDFGFGPENGGDGDFILGLTKLVINLALEAINALLDGLGGIKWWNV